VTNEDSQLWRVKTVRGDVFTVRTVLAISPRSRDESWGARAPGREETASGATPRLAVLHLALGLGWEVSEIAAPGERLVSECSEAVGAAMKLSLAHVAAAIRVNSTSRLASNLHTEVKRSPVSREEMDASNEVDRDAEKAHDDSIVAEVDLHAAILGEIGDELIDSAFGPLVMEIRSLLEDES
jgi:hypothetical protein